MDTQTQRALVERFFDLQRRRTTDLAEKTYRGSAAHYTSGDVLAKERSTLFRGVPIVGCLSADVQEPGEYVSLNADGMPLIIIRGEDGNVRTLVNACRHRGARVFAEGRGHHGGRNVTCPFHAWTYDVYGRLLGQPLAREGFSDCDNDLLNLRSLPTEERHGLVFVTPLDIDEEPRLTVDEVLGDIGPELDPFELSTWFHVETREFDVGLNWKFVMDTFLESYHIFALHKGSIGPWYFSSPGLFDSFGPTSRVCGVRATITSLTDKPAEEWSILPHATVLHILPPNTVLVYQQDHVEMWKMFPGSDPGTSRVVGSLYAPKEPHSEKSWSYWRKNLDFAIQITSDEDFPQAQQCQASLASGALDSLIYGRNEPGLVHFHMTVDGWMNRFASSEKAGTDK
jgi:phenylpropionate dioxygenase-like ring-hydroxylating dioxygenase large terminal subunit